MMICAGKKSVLKVFSKPVQEVKCSERIAISQEKRARKILLSDGTVFLLRV